MAAAASLQSAINSARLQLIQDIQQQDACKAINAGCFAAGTKLWTPDGYRNVEDIQEGEFVYSRDEWDPEGAIESKVVEANFERTGRILHLHLTGGNLIRTTPEHPFYERERGWLEAGALQAGDEIRTDSGWATVEEVFDTRTYENVYNLRVAEHHTYFVAESWWRSAVWAHNTACKDYYIAEDMNTPVGNSNRWTVFQKQHGKPFNDPSIGVLRGTSANDVWNKLAATPGDKIKQASVVKIPPQDQTSWSNVIKSYKTDPLNQQWTGTNWINLVPRPTGAPADHAHHIVMKKGAGATAQADVRATQKILQSFDLDPYYGKENLVWAPNWNDHSQVDTQYAHAVYLAVAAAPTKQDVVDALKLVALQFIRGDWQ